MGTLVLHSNQAGVLPTGAYLVRPAVPPPARAGRISGSIVSPTDGLSRGRDGTRTTGGGTPVGTPDYPCIAGPEILPIASATVPVDLGTRYDFEHDLNTEAIGTPFGRVAAQFAPAKARQNHVIAFDLYANGNELTNDDVTTVVLPLRRVDKGATAAVKTSAGGAGVGTALQALATPGGEYVALDATLATSWVKLWFDPAQLTTFYPTSRVVRIGLRWLAWRDDSSAAAPGEGVSALLWDTAVFAPGGWEYGNWLVQDYRHNAEYALRWYGETNYFSRGQALTFEHNKYPFCIADLARMGIGNPDPADDEDLFLQLIAAAGDSSQTTVNFDYVEMVVEVAPERRAGVASRVVSNILIDGAASFDFGRTCDYWVEWRYPFDTRSRVSIGTVTGLRYVLTMREALPASPSDRYRALTVGQFYWSVLEAIGPSLQVMGITQARATQAPQLETRIGTISDGVLVGTPEPFEDYNLAVVHYDGATIAFTDPFWAAFYEVMTAKEQAVFFTGNDTQFFPVDGVTSYSYVRIMVKPDPLTTADLVIAIQQAGIDLTLTSITAAAVRALPDAGGGYRILEVLMPATVTPTAGTASVQARSSTPDVAPWLVSGAHLLCGGNLYAAGSNSLAMGLACPLAAPPAPTVSTVMSPAAEACGVTTILSNLLTWAADPAVFAYGVNRSADGGTTWALNIGFAYGAAAVAGVLTYSDLGTPWDVPVSYYLTAYRASDLLHIDGAVTVAGALASQGAVIGISDETTTMIYAPTSESGGVSTPWTDLSPVEYVQLSGENYQRAIRAPEDRGLSFATTVLVKDLKACTVGNTVEPLTVGQRGLNPTGWDLVRYFAKRPHVDVRFPGGHTRRMSLELTGLVGRNQHGVYMGEFRLTDVATDNLTPVGLV